MTTETAFEYAQRTIRTLGQSVQDVERTIIWCYDNPPRKPLPKTKGERTNNVYLPRDVVRCLSAISDGNPSSLAESILRLWIMEQVPEVQAMFERHEQEIEMRLTELRQQEPQLLWEARKEEEAYDRKS